MARKSNSKSEKKESPTAANASRRKLSAAVVRMLGKVHDTKIAREFNIPRAEVSAERNRLGIPPFERIDWSAGKIRLLGKKSDGQIAKMFGITPTSVFRKRTMLGIPPFG